MWADFPANRVSHMETTLEYIRAQLDKRFKQGQLQEVADGAGVCLRTINYIRGGRGAHSKTIDKLAGYLRKNSRRKSLEGAA